MSDGNANLYLALHQIAIITSRSLADIGEVWRKLAAAGGASLEVEAATEEAASTIAAVSETPPPPPTPEITPPGPTPPAEPLPPPAPEYISVEQAAKENDRSAAVIYNLLKTGVLERHYPYGKALVMVDRAKVKALLGGSPKRWRTPAPEGMVYAPEAAAELHMSAQSVYNLIRAGGLPGSTQTDGGRFLIPRKALDEHKRAMGFAPIFALNGVTTPNAPVVEKQPQAPTPVDPPEPPPPSLLPKLVQIEEEANSLESYLQSMSPAHRASHLANWAGMARKIADDEPPLMRRCWTFLNRLMPIAEKYGVWVNALMPSWTIEDWDLYIRAKGTADAKLGALEEQVIVEGDVRAVMIRSKIAPVDHIKLVAEQAKQVLGEQNTMTVRIQKLLASKQAAATPVPPPPLGLPDEILSLTRGKRLLIVGGQGERDKHREQYIEKLQLTECEWVTADRGRGNQVLKVEARATPKNFDMLIYLAAYTSHSANKLLVTAKKRKLPIVRLARGYSVAQLAEAIKEQYTAGSAKPTNNGLNGHRNGHAKHA